MWKNLFLLCFLIWVNLTQSPLLTLSQQQCWHIWQPGDVQATYFSNPKPQNEEASWQLPGSFHPPDRGGPMLDFHVFDIANGSRASILPWKPTFSHQKRSRSPKVMVRNVGEQLLGSFPRPADTANVSSFLASFGENQSFASLGLYSHP